MQADVPNPNEPNSALSYYIHTGSTLHPRTRVLAAFLAQYLREPAFNVLRTFGNLAPMFSVPSSDPGFNLPGASPLAPPGCSITQVHLVHRHGARYPTSGSAPADFAAKVHNATVNGTGFSATGELEFLNTWRYKVCFLSSSLRRLGD